MNRKQYYFIDVPRLAAGKRDCIAMAYSDSKDIEAHYETVDIPNGCRLVWNRGRLRLPKRMVGPPTIILEINS